MNKKYIIVLLVILFFVIGAIGYMFSDVSFNENDLNFNIPDGFKYEKTINETVYLTDGTIRIKINEEKYNDQLVVSVDTYKNMYPDLNVTKSVKRYSNGIISNNIKLVNGSDIQNHYWFNNANRTYHVYMHGDNQDVIDELIESFK